MAAAMASWEFGLWLTDRQPSSSSSPDEYPLEGVVTVCGMIVAVSCVSVVSGCAVLLPSPFYRQERKKLKKKKERKALLHATARTIKTRCNVASNLFGLTGH